MPLQGEAKKEYQRGYMRLKRKGIRETIRVNGDKPCELCGWAKSTETHHEGELKEEHILCPNHHALISRGLTTLEELKAKQGLTDEGSNKEYPAILLALVDPIKRKKLEKIVQSLNAHKVVDKVYYGCGRGSVPFDIVGDLLEATML